MIKDFKKWHKEKADLQENKERPEFREREVWFAAIGANIGFEQDGKGEDYLRPVVIIKKFNSEVCWALPTTGNDKNGKYYFPFSYRGTEHTTAILSQLRLIDAKRLRYKIGKVSSDDFKEMQKRLISFLK